MAAVDRFQSSLSTSQSKTVDEDDIISMDVQEILRGNENGTGKDIDICRTLEPSSPITSQVHSLRRWTIYKTETRRRSNYTLDSVTCLEL